MPTAWKKKSIILAVHSMVTVLICSINLFFFTSSAGSEKPSTWCEPAISVWNEENSYVLFRDFAEARLWIGCVPGIFLALTHELARQIEKVMCIVVCSPQLCSFQNCLFSGPTRFHAIIRAHFLPIWLQQYAWICDKHYLQIQNLNTSVLQTLHITCYSRARQDTNPYYCFSYTAFHAQG